MKPITRKDSWFSFAIRRLDAIVDSKGNGLVQSLQSPFGVLQEHLLCHLGEL